MMRRPLSLEHRMQIGATLIGIPLDEYRANRGAGLKRCSRCKAWNPRDAFPRRGAAGDGLNSECRGCANPRSREYMRALAAQRREAAAALDALT